ncbi:MAG: radical SAM protein, partial [Clostridia bacterium]|nr:radical SAM protein [Clostridia bacterium]
MNFLDKYKKDFEEYDRMESDFIDDDKIWGQLNKWANPSKDDVRSVLKKAQQKIRLDPEETAILIQNQDPETIGEMYELAHKLKEEVYGDRIVFFAPLYISDECANDCVYCGFRRSNHAMQRKTLTMDELEREVRTMIDEGQKRTVLVYGESPNTNIDYMCETVRKVYSVKTENGCIRRANINCAPLSREELAKFKEVGIGTFQVFQETYHHETYRRLHPAGTIKGNYRWRLYAMDRAQDAKVDDSGIGALFGLYDWRFEVMGLLYHAIHL